MKTLEEEAELYSTMTMFYNAETKEIPTEKQVMEYEYVSEIAFKAGANSKWVQSEKIRSQIESVRAVDTYGIKHMLEYYEIQLKELEDEGAL